MNGISLILIILVVGVIFLFLYNSKDKDKTRIVTVRRSGKKQISHFRPPESVEIQPDLQHPVLAYQRAASYGTVPASIGDPIRPLLPSVGPPLNSGGGYRTNNNGRAYAYEEFDGPYPGKALNIPVPQGSLKMSSEKYRYPFYAQQRPLAPYDYFRPYGPNQDVSSEASYADTPFYKRPPSSQYATGYTGSGAVPFISSVNAFAPFPEVTTPWEKSGTLTTTDLSDGTILNLYRRPIAPLQDLYRYSVQDKNGFIIPLLQTNFLEDGDIVPSVQGKENKGSWVANIYVGDKYVWT